MRYFVDLDDGFHFLSVGKLYVINQHGEFIDDEYENIHIDVVHADCFTTLVIEL